MTRSLRFTDCRTAEQMRAFAPYAGLRLRDILTAFQCAQFGGQGEIMNLLVHEVLPLYPWS
jgi:hypothetical protein